MECKDLYTYSYLHLYTTTGLMELLVSWTGCSCQVGGDSELRRLRLLSEFVCPRLSLWTVPAVADASKLFIVLSSYQLLGSLDASLELLEVGQSKPSRQSKGYKTSKPRKTTESLDARKYHHRPSTDIPKDPTLAPRQVSSIL